MRISQRAVMSFVSCLAIICVTGCGVSLKSYEFSKIISHTIGEITQAQRYDFNKQTQMWVKREKPRFKVQNVVINANTTVSQNGKLTVSVPVNPASVGGEVGGSAQLLESVTLTLLPLNGGEFQAFMEKKGTGEEVLLGEFDAVPAFELPALQPVQ